MHDQRDQNEKPVENQHQTEDVPPAGAPEATPAAAANVNPTPPASVRRPAPLFPWLLAGIFLLALGLQGWVFSGKVYWISSDESGRTQHAWHWATQPSPGQLRGLLDTWPPLPRLLTGLALRYVYSDIFVTPRLLAALFSVLAMAALLLLAHELFASRAVTLAAGLLAALYSQRLILSVVPLAEIQYLAWVLLALFLALRGLRRGHPGWLLAAAAAFALGMMVRYEAWLFGGFYLAALFRRMAAPRRQVRGWTFALCTAVVLAFPCFWIWLFTTLTGHPFGFIEKTAELYQGRYGANLWRNFQLSAPWQLCDSNLRQLNLLGVVGVAVWAWFAGARRIWLLVPLGALAALGLLGLLGKAMPTHNFWRIATLWGMVLIPFTAACCVGCLPRGMWTIRRLGRWHWIPVLLPLTLLASLFFYDARNYRRMFETLPDLVQTGDFLRTVMQKSDEAGQIPFRILIERTPDYNHLNIEVIARDFSRFVLNTEFDPKSPAPPQGEPQRSRFLARLRAENVRLLVYRTVSFKNTVVRYPGVQLGANHGQYAVFILP